MSAEKIVLVYAHFHPLSRQKSVFNTHALPIYFHLKTGNIQYCLRSVKLIHHTECFSREELSLDQIVVGVQWDYCLCLLFVCLRWQTVLSVSVLASAPGFTSRYSYSTQIAGMTACVRLVVLKTVSYCSLTLAVENTIREKNLRFIYTILIRHLFSTHLCFYCVEFSLDLKLRQEMHTQSLNMLKHAH